MRTPGRCTNVEGCWISASHRNVWLPIGEDFACPNCGGNLSAPLPQTRSFRGVKRVAAISAVASLGLTVLAIGAEKLSTVSWPGQSMAATVARVPEALAAAVVGRPVRQTQLATDDGETMRPLSASGEQRTARDVAAAGPNSPFAMQGASSFNARVAAAHANVAGVNRSANRTLEASTAAQTREANAAGHVANSPYIIYAAGRDSAASSAAITGADDRASAGDQAARAAMSEIKGAVVVVSQTELSPAEAMQRPVILPITFGRPIAPETDFEPITLAWHHHGVIGARHSAFLPAVPTESRPASADAIAQICRIPSLMH